jgi:hypothetical protein
MKELLEQLAAGTTTVDDVLKAIDDSDKDKVPRSRLNDKIAEVKDLEGELEKRNAQLTELGDKAQGNEQLTEEINKLKAANEQQAQEYEAKLQKQQFEAKLSDALRGAKVRNPRAVKALLDTEKIKLDGDKLLGLDDQLGAIKESDAYLFDQEDEGTLAGRKPNGNKDTAATGLTPDAFKALSYKERVEFKQSQPEQYEALSKSE